MKKSKVWSILVLMIAASMLSACFPKAYTNKEEKEQLAHAIAIARVYQEKYAPSARFDEQTFHVYDSMPENDRKLYLTDWVYGEYKDGGKYNVYINTTENKIYSDKEWNKVQVYGQKLAEQLYGLDEKQMTVDVWGYTELPFCKDDASFGMLTLTKMISATDKVSKSYVRDLLQSDEYRFTYRIDVNESVNIDMFKKFDYTPLGKNVRLSVRRYSDDAFANRKYYPEKRSVADKEGLLDEYYSDQEDDETKEEVSGESVNNGYEGTWYAQDESGAVLTIENGKIDFEQGDIDDQSQFDPEEKDGYISLEVEKNEDDLFWFYEINYYSEDDKIEAYTWPEDDGDGGYRRTEFKRTQYEIGDTKMLEILYGDWEIMDDAELIQEPGIRRDRLRFALPQYHRVRFITAGGDMESFDIKLQDVFEEADNTYDRLILSNRPGSGKYDWDEVRPGQSFQIMIANNLGWDYMMLRELGDERTGFATDGLKYDRSIQGLWMLRRPDPNDYDNEFDEEMTTPSTVGIEDEIRQKDTSFYAIKWMEFGNSCTLQRVETAKTTLDGKDALEYFLPDDEYAYSAVNYEYKGQENMAHGGYFDPALVHVTTDKNGQITDIAILEYAYEGLYYDREIRQ